jgi:hypothetical protein
LFRAPISVLRQGVDLPERAVWLPFKVGTVVYAADSQALPAKPGATIVHHKKVSFVSRENPGA